MLQKKRVPDAKKVYNRPDREYRLCDFVRTEVKTKAKNNKRTEVLEGINQVTYGVSGRLEQEKKHFRGKPCRVRSLPRCRNWKPTSTVGFFFPPWGSREGTEKAQGTGIWHRQCWNRWGTDRDGLCGRRDPDYLMDNTSQTGKVKKGFTDGQRWNWVLA